MNFMKKLLNKQKDRIIVLLVICSLVLSILIIILFSLNATNNETKLNDHQLSIEKNQKNISNLNDSLDTINQKINNLKGSLLSG